MRVSDFIFKYLADNGVQDVFMISGGGAMFLNDALGQEKRIRTICNHHEQGTAIAAEGYARATGKLAVASVTTGPGGTNAITGVIGGWLDSIPILFISGQVKFSTSIASRPGLPLRQLGDQEINIVDIVRPITKYAVMVTEPRKIRYELEKAIHIAMTGRKGPVWLDIPINVQSAEVNESELERYTPAEEKCEIPAGDIAALYQKFLTAKSPVIVAGHGIRLADAVGELEQLIEKLKIPLLGTFEGFDMLPSDSPYYAGRIGTIGTRAGNIVLQNADFVLCIGTRNNIRQASYNYENFAKRAETVAVVDIDPAELQKNTIRVTDPIHCDAGDFLKEFLAAAKSAGVPDFSSWLKWCIARERKYNVVPETEKNLPGINPYHFTRILTDLLPEKTIVSCTNATPSLALFQSGTVKKGQIMYCNSGCAAMGFGLPAALGGAVSARNGELTVCLEGDGSLMMNMQELQTVRHLNLNMKLFLYNNNEYCSIRQTQDNFFEGRHSGCDNGSGVTFPNWKILASAFNWRYEEINSAEEAEAKLPGILTAEGPVFVEVKLVPGYRFEPKLSSRKLPDGTMISASLEDMFPFLPEDEMKQNIYQG
ncbi:MAG: thiamine pyrophosphate-binding protein [Lentisphaeria bacterium]|nr:thiamine pyrophosphate-binding protein [Lentisphaeria bacterium]